MNQILNTQSTIASMKQKKASRQERRYSGVSKLLTGSWTPLGFKTTTLTSPRPALNVSTMKRAGLPAVLPIASKPFHTKQIHNSKLQI